MGKFLFPRRAKQTQEEIWTTNHEQSAILRERLM